MGVDADLSDPLVPSRPAPARRPVDVLLAFVRFVGPVRLAGGAVLAVVVLVAGVWLLRPPPAPVEASLPFAAPVTAPDGAAATVATTAPSPATIVVHVAGAVERPGLVELNAGARVADAVAAAGGARADADASALNLAQRVSDGQRVHVPAEGEPPPPGGWWSEPSPDEPGGGGPLRLVDVNRATIDELRSLPGVGPATALAIVSHRERVGSFGHVDDLLDVRGIGPAKLDAIRDLVTV